MCRRFVKPSSSETPGVHVGDADGIALTYLTERIAELEPVSRESHGAMLCREELQLALDEIGKRIQIQPSGGKAT